MGGPGEQEQHGGPGEQETTWAHHDSRKKPREPREQEDTERARRIADNLKITRRIKRAGGNKENQEKY